MPEMRRPGMGLGEALYYALTGRSPKSAERMSVQQKTQEMVKNLGGSTRRAAEAAGVTMRTIQRRLKGEVKEVKNTKTRKNADNLDRAHRASRIKPARAAKLAASAKAPAGGGTGVGGLTITGTIQVSEDIRDRTINPGTKIPEGALDDIAQILAAQGEQAAAAALTGALQNYVPGIHVLGVDAIDYE